MRDPWETDVPTEEVPLESPSQPVMAEANINAINQPNPAITAEPSYGAENDLSPKNQPSGSSQTINTSTDEPFSLLSFNRRNLLLGVVWAEILSKPRSKRGRL